MLWVPASWAGLLACGGVYTVVYLIVAGVGLFGVDVWRTLLRRASPAERTADANAGAIAGCETRVMVESLPGESR
jgi:hypothetical protein